MVDDIFTQAVHISPKPFVYGEIATCRLAICAGSRPRTEHIVVARSSRWLVLIVQRQMPGFACMS